MSLSALLFPLPTHPGRTLGGTLACPHLPPSFHVSPSSSTLVPPPRAEAPSPQQPAHEGLREMAIKEKKKRSIFFAVLFLLSTAPQLALPHIPGTGLLSRAVNSCQTPGMKQEPHSKFPNFWLCSSGPDVKWKPAGIGSAAHHLYPHGSLTYTV